MTETGSLDVSLSQLAERAGVNSALVKYYFKSKSGMMFELAKQTLADPIEQLLQSTLKATFGINKFTEEMKNDFIEHLTETLLGGIRK